MNVAIPPRAVWVVGGVIAVVVVGLFFCVRNSDPASRPPIPHMKVNYQAYMERQQQHERQRPPDGRP